MRQHRSRAYSRWIDFGRLAIRLAVHIGETNIGWEVRCAECEESKAFTSYDDAEPDELKHTPDCPIAELEAEEAESVKLSVGGVEVETVPVPAWKTQFVRESGDDWIAELTGAWEPATFDMKDGARWVGYVRKVPASTKPAGEFEGEY